MQFHGLHKLFDEFALEVIAYVDMYAKRATTLGGVAKGAVKLTAKYFNLTHSSDTFDNSEFTVKKYVMLAESTRNSIEVSEKMGD